MSNIRNKVDNHVGDKLHEIASLMHEVSNTPLTSFPSTNKEPAALDSLRSSVVWIPYSLRFTLVRGLPLSTQQHLIKAFDEPCIVARQLTEAAINFDEAKPNIPEPSYLIRLADSLVSPRYPNKNYKTFSIDRDFYQFLFNHGDEEFPTNAYILKRWLSY